MRLRERDIERTCSDLLALDGWRALKCDPVSRREWGKGFGEKGMADVLYIRYSAGGTPQSKPRCAEVLWIEWKTPQGKTSLHQIAWHRAERARGALTWIAGIDFPAGIDAFLKFYRTSGLMRRAI